MIASTIKKKNIIFGYLFFCILFSGIFFLISTQDYSNLSGVVFITFFINGIIILTHMLKNNEIGYSLMDMFDIFMFFFMFTAPLLQYINNEFPWVNAQLITDSVIIKSNFIILAFIVIVYITKYNKLNTKVILKTNVKNKKIFSNMKFILEIGFYISIAVTIFIIYQTGFTNLFSRNTNNLSFDNKSLTLIVNNSLRAFPLITTLISLKYKNLNKYLYKKSHFIILILCTVLLHFPTGMPRFQVAVVYLSLILVYKEKFKNKYLFKMAIVFGLLIIFPMINIFRRNTFGDITNLSIEMPNPMEMFISGDFDAYSMLCRSILYVDMNGISFGEQLLGSILFFIPRSLWPSKPGGSGIMVIEEFGAKFTNVSMPLVGEGYLNFGLIGIVVFAIIIGNMINQLDNKIQIHLHSQIRNDASLLEILYPLLIGYLFFILRGDLLSSLSYTIGYSLPVIFLYLISKLINNIYYKG